LSFFHRIEHDPAHGTGKVLIDFNALNFLLGFYCDEESHKKEMYQKIILIHTTAYRNKHGEHT
jgi:hypothetical protein